MEPTLKLTARHSSFFAPLITNPLTPNRLRGILGFILLLTLMAGFCILLGGIPSFFLLWQALTPKTENSQNNR
jgi:hypothetical protein